MLAALLAVLVDLWRFAIGKGTDENNGSPDLNHKKQVGTPEKEYILQPSSSVTTDTTNNKVVDTVRFPDGSPAYVLVERAYCLKRPVVSFDEVLRILSYGDMVLVSHIEGLYAHVEAYGVTGWVRVDALTEDRKSIFPALKPGCVYDAQHENTKQIRRWLDDVTLAEVLRLPLQPEEFLLYTLSIKNLHVSWPNVRPRKSGEWHKILKGVRGVKSNVEPKTSSIIEYVSDDGRGVLGYVQSVTPELTITMLSVGRFIDGECREDVLPVKEWRELRPVFITIQ